MKAERAYHESTTRPAHSGGEILPGLKPHELRAFLDALYLREEGPGVPPQPVTDGEPLKLLVVPHIDFDRGGHSYAHGYLTLARPDGPIPPSCLA